MNFSGKLSLYTRSVSFIVRIFHIITPTRLICTASISLNKQLTFIDWSMSVYPYNDHQRKKNQNLQYHYPASIIFGPPVKVQRPYWRRCYLNVFPNEMRTVRWLLNAGTTHSAWPLVTYNMIDEPIPNCRSSVAMQLFHMLRSAQLCNIRFKLTCRRDKPVHRVFKSASTNLWRSPQFPNV